MAGRRWPLFRAGMVTVWAMESVVVGVSIEYSEVG